MKASPASTAIEPGTVWSRPDSASAPEENLFERLLITAAKDGCDESFRILVERHQDRIYRLCCQLLTCSEDAREACQDALVRAHESLSRFVPKARFSTWLYRIALNHCRDRLRARRARKRWPSAPARRGHGTDPATTTASCPRPAPDESLALSEDLARLRQGIAQLPRRLREPLVLVALEGLRQEECAAILGCSVRAVEGRLYRARRALLDWWDAQP